MKTLPIEAKLFALSFGLALAAIASAQKAPARLDGAQYVKEAKVSLAQAQAAALKAYPGTIVDQELEKERGGSGLRYSFDVKNGQVTHEVGVDARTGRVLENSVEGPGAD